MKLKIISAVFIIFLNETRGDNTRRASVDNDNAHVIREGKKEIKVLSRDERSLVYPGASQLVLIFGLGTPLQLDRESVIVGAFTKLLYDLPSNATDFTSPTTINYRDDKSKSRWEIYKQFEKLTSLYGLGGKVCLLKAICQVAHVPFDHNHGLLGQLVQTLLTPSSTAESYEEHEDQEYHSAEKLGRHVGEYCHALYPECSRSVLDIFSTTTDFF